MVDNGSWECRAGWAGEPVPRLSFRSQAARLRREKGAALVHEYYGGTILTSLNFEIQSHLYARANPGDSGHSHKPRLPLFKALMSLFPPAGSGERHRQRGVAAAQPPHALRAGHRRQRRRPVARLDHALGRLGLADDGHLCGRRLALTEPPAMPLYARTTTTELAFEHYGVSALAYAVDGLLAADTMDAPPDRLVSE